MSVTQHVIVVQYSYQTDDETGDVIDVVAPNVRHKRFTVRGDETSYNTDTEQFALAARAHNSCNEFLDENGWPYKPGLTETDKKVGRAVLEGARNMEGYESILCP